MTHKGNKKNCGVSIITCTNRLDYIDNIFNNYSNQNINNKELIIILNNNKMSIKKYKSIANEYTNVLVYQLDESSTYGECKNFAYTKTNYDLIAFFDDDDYYAPNYLRNSIVTFENTDCDILGKASFYIYFEKSKILALVGSHREYKYVSHVADSSMIVKRKVLEKVTFPKIKGSGTDNKFQKSCIKEGFRIYSADKFNFLICRHPRPAKQHVWQIEEKNLLRSCKIIKRNTNDYKKYIHK